VKTKDVRMMMIRRYYTVDILAMMLTVMSSLTEQPPSTA